MISNQCPWRWGRAAALGLTPLALACLSACGNPTPNATGLPPSSAITTTPVPAAASAAATSESAPPAPRPGGRYWPCVNPTSAQDVADLYGGVTTAVRARVTEDRKTSPLAFGSVETPTPGSEVTLHDVQVLWGQAPSSLTLYDPDSMGHGMPDGDYVLVLMPVEPQRGLYTLGMGLFGAYSIDGDDGLHSYCIDYSDPGWKHRAPDAIRVDDLVAYLTGAFGSAPKEP